MTVRPERSPSLGRGLAALIPQRAAGQPARPRSPSTASGRTPYQPRVRFDEAELETLDREHPRARRPPADPRDRDPRRLPARRRRAPLARGPGGRPGADPGGRPPARRGRTSSRSPSSRTSSARTSTRSRPRTASAGSSTSSGSPRSGSRRASGERARPSPTRSACSTSRRSSRRRSIDRSITEGHARALGGLSVEHQEHVLGIGHRPGPVRSPDRGARPPASRGRTAGDAGADRSRPAVTRIWTASRRTCVGPSARRSAWPAPGAAGGSSSSTTATKSWGGCTSA